MYDSPVAWSPSMVDGALSVEVRGGLVAVEVREDGCQSLAAFENVRGLGAFAVHEHRESGVDGEEGFLSVGVAAVSAVGIGVEKFPDGETVGCLRCVKLGVHGHERVSSGSVAVSGRGLATSAGRLFRFLQLQCDRRTTLFRPREVVR